MYEINSETHPTTRKPTAREAAALLLLLDDVSRGALSAYRFTVGDSLSGTYCRNTTALILKYPSEQGDVEVVSVKFSPLEIPTVSDPASCAALELAHRYLTQRAKSRKARFSVILEVVTSTSLLYRGDSEQLARDAFENTLARRSIEHISLTLLDRESGTIRAWDDFQGDRTLYLDPVADRVAKAEKL